MRFAIPIPILLLVFSATTSFGWTNRAPSDGSLRADSIPYQVISKGGDAGDYQAFADACRLKNGDIAAVFYAGYGHVSSPNEAYPKGGRLCMVRSKDEGQTWSKPVTIYDDPEDNRDPHISQLNDGTILVSFFSLVFKPGQERQGIGPQLIRSTDNGITWDKTALTIPVNGAWYCSAPVRELPNGTLVFPVYHQEGKGDALKAWGGVLLSKDKGKTWGEVIPIGQEANLPLAAETDVILLKDNTLLAALRAQKDTPMHYATSNDMGASWTPVKSFGFLGHSPAFTRLKSGEILLTYRGFTKGGDWATAYTALQVSFDDGKSWQGPYRLDKTTGAYPSTVDLKDGTVLCIYYEEGKGSAIRALHFKKPRPARIPAGTIQPVETIAWK
ncbi:hypothetical protein GCM10028803_42630 [Larkinella knui]|uniref:Exo-alpha-sialidase n=1 Tax=Larkinella knui TaxID=2025310 RepID=A0A3P1CNJ0_9BACT|nr:sialidase family protein [Larkinella knui]RRB14891.1 exo-alpha-sialidase [Larkinella knui]